MTSGHEISPTVIEGADDVALPFSVEALDVRGRVVRLGPSVDTILRRHGYPDPVARLLGEAAALTVLLGSSLKFEGRFQFQTKSDGPVEMIVVDFEAPDRLRATARFDAERVKALGTTPLKSADLIGQGHLAMTIDQGNDFSRYQGVVALEGQSLEEAAHQYFRQSEQIPTQVRLAVAEQFANGTNSYRAGGLLVQFLPQSIDRARLADLPPGDIPEGHAHLGEGEVREDDAWVEARSLVNTVEDHELVRSGGFLRAAALPAFPRARRAGVRGAAHPRALPVLTGARPRHDPLLRPAGTPRHGRGRWPHRHHLRVLLAALRHRPGRG